MSSETKTEWTPGPWIARRNVRGPSRDGNEPRTVSFSVSTGDGLAICEIPYPYSTRPREQHWADAQLIASAPALVENNRELANDLYGAHYQIDALAAALRAVDVAFSATMGYRDCPMPLYEAIAEARRVLSEIEGE